MTNERTDRLSAADMRKWQVTFPDDDLNLTVDAVYPTSDDNLPGWTLFKNWRHKIVMALHPSDRIVYMQPLDQEE